MIYTVAKIFISFYNTVYFFKKILLRRPGYYFPEIFHDTTLLLTGFIEIILYYDGHVINNIKRCNIMFSSKNRE